MFGLLILSKILVSVTFVVGLSLVAERVSPKVAGILAGYPLGAAISLFFYGVEIGPDFAALGAVYTLAGLAAALVFVWGYYLAAKKFRRGQIALASLSAILFFLAAGKLISMLPLNLSTAFSLTFSSILLFGYLFRNVPNVLIKRKIHFSYTVLFIRGGFAALVILLVTGIAHWVGPNWAGILSAFPVTLFPLLVLIHFSYGREQVFTIIKNFPFGIGALIVYAITIHYTYGTLGVPLGTAWSFVAATAYLLLYSQLMRWLQNRSGPDS